MNKRNFKHAFKKAWEDLKLFWTNLFKRNKKPIDNEVIDSKENTNKDSRTKIIENKILRFGLFLICITLVYASSHKNCNTALDNQGGVLTVNAEEYDYNNLFGPIYFANYLGDRGPDLQPNLLTIFRDAETGDFVDVGNIYYQNVDYYFPRVYTYRTGPTTGNYEDRYLFPVFNHLTFTLVYTSELGYVGYIISNTFYPFSKFTINDYNYSSKCNIMVPYYSGNYFTAHDGISGSSKFYHIEYDITFAFSYYSTNSDFIVQSNSFRYNASIEGYYGTWNCTSIKYADNVFADLVCDNGLRSLERVSYDDTDPNSDVYYRPSSIYYYSVMLSTAKGLDLSTVGTLPNGLPNVFQFCNQNKIIEIYTSYVFDEYYAGYGARLYVNSEPADMLNDYRWSSFTFPFTVFSPVTMPTGGAFPDYLSGGLPYYCKLTSLTNVYESGYDEGYDAGYDFGYDEGEDDGFQNGLDAAGYEFNPFNTLSDAVDSLLNTPLITDSNNNTMVSIGTLFRVGIGVLLFGVLIKVFLGG